MRIRTIKPEFWMHEGLCRCSEFTRLLAIALLNWSDDEGYFMANPILIRGQLFPFLDDSKMIPRSLQDLSNVGWIRLGKDDQNRDVGMVVNFAKHQRVDKPKPSEIKGSIEFQEQSKNHTRIIQDASKEERKGKEGNGKEGKYLLSASGRCDDRAFIENLWSCFNATSKARSSRKQLEDAWKAVTPKPDYSATIESARAWAASHEWTKDGGTFAPAAHLWVKRRKWEDSPPNGKPIRQQTFAGIQEDIPLP